MRTLSLVAVLTALGVASVANARPVEDGTRITLFAGGRYVPHHHFEQLALQSGDPVLSSQSIGPAALASFAYAPSPSIEISLEVGYANDHYTLQTGDLTLQNVPIVGSLRWMPFDGRLYPYLGGGGGYVLGFLGGKGAGSEVESHAQELHVLAGVTFEISSTLWLSLEDRQAFAAGDVVPIGQLQEGGNTFMLGLSFVLEPARSLAPHE